MVVPDILRLEYDIVRFALLLSYHGVANHSFFSAFEYTYLLLWNVFWSIAPVIAIGIFDRDIGECCFPVLFVLTLTGGRVVYR